MAGRRKLQEDFAHMAGIGDLQCHPNGIHVYTGGSDAAIRVFTHDNDQFRLVSDLSGHHTHPIRCLAFSPSGDTLASSSDDTTVQLFNLPPFTAGGSYSPPKFESTLFRNSHGPVLSVCYHPSSLFVALGCSDGLIRIVSVLDPSQVREVKGHAGSVRHLTYDGTGDFLASIDHLGVLMISRPNDRSCVLMETVMGRSDVTSSAQQARCAFSPDSQQLALPGKKDIAIRSREGGWKRDKDDLQLKGGHSHDVSVVAWSGSGRYLLSASLGRVVVWEVESCEMFSQCDVDGSCNSAQWSTKENSIVLMDENGYIKKWNQPIPQHMPQPFKQEDAEVEREMDRKEAAEQDDAVDTAMLQPVGETNEDEDEDAEKADKSERKKEETDEDEAGRHRKRLRRAGELTGTKGGGDGDGQAAALSDFDDDDMDGLDGFIVDDTNGLYKDNDDDYLSRKARQSLTHNPHTQPPFQPSSTPLDPTTKRRYLCFNLIGSVVSQAGPAFNSLEIVFSDSVQHKAIRLRDHYGFTMAALGQHGCVMASRWESTTKPSVVFYRAFDSWATNSDWTLHLPSPETAVGVAVGGKFVAVGTDRQFVRLQSYSGMQLSVWSLRGPIVSMVAHQQLLCVVYHSAMPLPSHQCLSVMLMDVERRVCLLDSALAVSPGASLTWLGYSDKGALLTMDSAGVVRVLSEQWGGQWVPVLDVGGKGKESHWPVGLIEDKLMCCICKGGLKVPNTLNRPVLAAIDLHIPFVQTETDKQEEVHARQDMMLFQQHKHKHSLSSSSSSSSTSSPFVYSPTPREQASLDKLLLPLVQLACKADQGSRAVDIVSRLGLVRSMEICLTLANSGRKVALSTRIGLMIGARRKEKEEEKEREKRRLAGGGREGAAITIEGFMEKGEKRADEERKRRLERLRQEEDGARNQPLEVEEDDGADNGDEGETELTYTRKGKKRVKLIERSDVDRQREERQREERQEKEAQEEQRRKKKEAEAEAAKLVEEDDGVEVTGAGGGAKGAVDFLTQFKRQKEREKAEKEREKKEKNDAEEKEKEKAKEKKKKEKSTKKGAAERERHKTSTKGKEKENEKQKEGEKEGPTEETKEKKMERAETEIRRDEGSLGSMVKAKPVNPFAKRTFAETVSTS